VEELLRALYPDYQWETAYFTVPPRQHKKLAAGFWADKHNQRQLLDGIGIELGIKKVIHLHFKRSNFDNTFSL